MKYPERDYEFMRIALAEARLALEEGEIPVGALVVKDGAIIARAHNTREATGDPVAHAELIAISNAGRALGDWRLSDCELFVTLEPCPMCAGAIINSRLARLVYGANDPRAGAVESVVELFGYPFGGAPTVASGLLADESRAMLKEFFENKRK